jgi:hypothetical protein
MHACVVCDFQCSSACMRWKGQRGSGDAARVARSDGQCERRRRPRWVPRTPFPHFPHALTQTPTEKNHTRSSCTLAVCESLCSLVPPGCCAIHSTTSGRLTAGLSRKVSSATLLPFNLRVGSFSLEPSLAFSAVCFAKNRQGPASAFVRPDGSFLLVLQIQSPASWISQSRVRRFPLMMHRAAGGLLLGAACVGVRENILVQHSPFHDAAEYSPILLLRPLCLSSLSS